MPPTERGVAARVAAGEVEQYRRWKIMAMKLTKSAFEQQSNGCHEMTRLRCFTRNSGRCTNNIFAHIGNDLLANHASKEL